MSLFKKEKKTTINTAILDLRNYTPEGLSKIKFINAAIVILPEEGDEFYTAYAAIKTNTASTLRLPKERQITNFNGVTEITAYTDNVIMSNGVLVLYKFESEKPVDVLSNGITVYDPDTKVNFINENGLSFKAPFTIEGTTTFPNKVSLNSQFFESVADKTIIVCGNTITIESDVEVSLLKSKIICLVAGNKIECSKKIIGYIQTIAGAGNTIEAYD